MSKNVKLLGIFILYILFSFDCFAQNKEIDDLKKELDKAEKSEKSAISFQIAVLYFESGDKRCEDYADDAVKEAKRNNQTDIQIAANRLLAEYYFKNSDFRKSAKSYESEYDLIKTTGNKKELAKSCFNLGRIQNNLENLRKSASYFEECVKLSEELQDKELIKRTYNYLYEVYSTRGKYEDAMKYLKKYIEISEFEYKTEKEQEISDAKNIISDAKKKISEAKNMISEKDEIIEQKDSVVGVISEQNENLEQLSIEQVLQIANLNLEKELSIQKVQNQRMSISLLILFLVLAILIAGFIYLRFVQKKRNLDILSMKNTIIVQQNEEINVQLEEISSAKEIIEAKNKHITDSIRYAERIQNAVFPSERILIQVFPESFILFHPRDIVSGDFYWIHERENKVMIIAADCTGHGIPGAFMSLLGISFLNEILPQIHNNHAGEILDFLRNKIKSTLNQRDETGTQKDGMDAALCVIDTKTLEMEFAGANNPLLIVRKTENLDKNEFHGCKIASKNGVSLIQINADKQPVAIYIKEKPFTRNAIQLMKNDKLYIFSDGYPDQFGGKNDKKFMIKKFKHLLMSIYDKPMNEQNEILTKTMQDWMGVHEQIDDILVVGIQV